MPDSESNIVQAEDDGSLGEFLPRLLQALIRRRWLIFGCMYAVSFATIGVLSYQPNRYTSEATIFAVQQRVPERYVVPTATSDVAQVLEAMVQGVLSRPQLLAVIHELNLYSKQWKDHKTEELVQRFRRDLTVEPIERKLGRGDVDAFKISFISDDPRTAQAVTQRLTTLFIEQNLKVRAEQATITTEFLRDQLERTKKDLDAQEERLRKFKMQYLGELPEQQQGNLGILGGLQNQLDSVLAGQSQSQQQRLYLESLLSEYQHRGGRSGATVVSSTGEAVTPLQAAISDLNRLETERKNLLAVYTSNHPDVVRKSEQIEVQKKFVEAVKAASVAKPERTEGAVEQAQTAEENIVVAQLRSQLLANKLELENLTKKELKLRSEIEGYQSRLNLTPVREQQLAEMQRDYELMRQHYGDLLKKEQESRLATDLEKRQEGQQFRLADPPNLPNVPSSPKRIKISLLGILGGLILGGALAFVVEATDSSFRSEDQAKQALELPIVIGIPAIYTPSEKRSRSRLRVLEFVACVVLLATLAVAEMYVYRHG